MNEENTNLLFPNDNPIENGDQDVFNRHESAKSFAQHVLKLDASKGAVVGIFSPWGHGKTSFFNLTRATLEKAKVPIFEFNPWLFSGTEQLVDRFFAELSAEMGEDKNLKAAGKVLKKYGDSISGATSILTNILGFPLVGDIVKTLLGVVKKLPQRCESTVKQRKRAEAKLKERSEPIIVVLDDVDRLSTLEIREIFKLVRLTASFPNLIYIVLCDRFRVEMALGEDGLPGREYLEKIIQLPYDLPEIPRDVLHSQLELEINRAISCVEGIDKPDPLEMMKYYDDIIHPLIRNMRDVRRYVAAIRETLSCLHGEVATPDVLGLEAVRLFLPDVFKLIPSSIDVLTVTSTLKSQDRDLNTSIRHLNAESTGNDRLDDKRKEELVTDAKAHQSVVHALFAYLFNTRKYSELFLEKTNLMDEWVGKLLQDRVVSHEAVLLRYLERVDSNELLNFRDAQRALNLLTDSAGFEKFIKSLPPERRMEVISSLYFLKNKFDHNQMEPGIIVLLNLLPFLTEESEFRFQTARKLVERITELLMRKFLKATPEEKLDATFVEVIQRILNTVTSLSSKVVLVSQLEQSSEDGQSKFVWVPNGVASQFQQELCKEIQSVPDEMLAKEPNVVMIREFVKSNCG